jgi:hypothetical protein
VSKLRNLDDFESMMLSNGFRKEISMAKGQQKGNREIKKPKSKVTKAPAAQSSPFAGVSKTFGGGGKKAR